MLFPTDPFSCTATVLIPVPAVIDSCSRFRLETEILTIDEEPLYFIDHDEDRTIPNMEIGDYIIRYTVYDICGGSATLDCLFRGSGY